MSTNREVFDQIAESWYQIRHWSRFTDELKEMAFRWGRGKLLNVGCAHGPDFLPFKEHFELWGADFSQNMIRLAQKYSAKFDFKVSLAVADASYLPYLDSTFDWAIAVATYHHIFGDEQRLKALQELRRVLKPKAEAFITVWNKWQPEFWLKTRDTNIPWTARGKTLYRYYHLFSYSELCRLLARAGFQVINTFPEKSYRFPVKSFSRNICALARAI